LIDCRPQPLEHAQARVVTNTLRVVRCRKRTPSRSRCRIEWLSAERMAPTRDTAPQKAPSIVNSDECGQIGQVTTTIPEFVSTESAIEMRLNLVPPNMISVGPEGFME
jgi:hypothetical protein